MVVPAHASSIAKVACVAAGCAAIVSSAGVNSGSASQVPATSLTMTVSGPAFAKSPAGDAMPAMSIHDASPGHGTSGMVTVHNPTTQSRFFWLSPAAIRDHIGTLGGRLSDSLQLSVLDVTSLSSPTSIYRGGVSGMGARPLGFLAPGASRTYSFTATLPQSKGLPSAPGENPYQGSTASIAYAWSAIEGSPVATTQRPPPPAKSPGPHRDSRPPVIGVSVPGRQDVLSMRGLEFGVSCGEPCRQTVTGKVSTATGRWPAPISGTSSGAARRTLRLHLGRAAYAAVRSALIGGHDASIVVSVHARDRAGNRAAKRRAIRLESAG